MLKQFFLTTTLLLFIRTQEESEDNEIEEDEEATILSDVKDLQATLEIFPQVFLYITKDDCQFCLSFDSIFEEVHKQVQQDKNGKNN